METVDSALQLILDTMGIYPAWVLSPRWDIIAWNQAACRVLGDVSVMTSRERHILWLLFTDARYRAMATDWEREAQRVESRYVVPGAFVQSLIKSYRVAAIGSDSLSHLHPRI